MTGKPQPAPQVCAAICAAVPLLALLQTFAGTHAAHPSAPHPRPHHPFTCPRTLPTRAAAHSCARWRWWQRRTQSVWRWRPARPAACPAARWGWGPHPALQRLLLLLLRPHQPPGSARWCGPPPRPLLCRWAVAPAGCRRTALLHLRAARWRPPRPRPPRWPQQSAGCGPAPRPVAGGWVREEGASGG